MGEKSIILEYGIYVSLVGFQICHILAFQPYTALIWLLQPGNNAKCGGLATSGSPQKGDKLSFFDCKAYS